MHAWKMVWLRQRHDSAALSGTRHATCVLRKPSHVSFSALLTGLAVYQKQMVKWHTQLWLG